MKRRLISFLMAVVLLFGAVVVSAPSVSAANEMKASEKIIELIKAFEGFISMPKKDYGQTTIGFGTACNAEDYPNGITRDEADKLMREAVARFETSVNYFAKKNGLKLSQHQFDALISFTYNLGASWLNNDSTLRRAVINGATGNEFLYAITMWCTAGSAGQKQILSTLVKRRLIEANVYLNGDYSTSVPANYDYVLFSTQMNDAANTARIQGYDSKKMDFVRPNPSKTGYRFLGWYTAQVGGAWVTTLDASYAGKTLYGHWQKGDGDGKGVYARYDRVTTGTVNVYDVNTQKVVKQLESGTTVSISADYMDEDGVKWGMTNSGWIELSRTRAPGSVILDDGKTVQVTVNTDGVNIRKGPGTSYAKVGTADKGQILNITKVEQGGSYLWGQFTDGWICLDYTNYENVIEDTESEDTDTVDPPAGEPIATGVIVDCESLRIRKGPGTGYAHVGDVAGGTEVEIYETTGTGSRAWARIDKGWISMNYVEITPVDSEDSGSTEKPDDSGTTEKPDEKPIATGVIVDCNTLRVRQGPGTKYNQVGDVAKGTTVEIYEIIGSGSQTWARISKGWINMTYVELTAEDSEDNGSTEKPDDSGTTETPDEKPIATGMVVDCNTLRIRKGPGTGYAHVGDVAGGTEVEIYEITGSGSRAWARIDKGWISMNYVELTPEDSEDTDSTEKPDDSGTTETPDEKPIGTGVIIDCDTLRIRKGPGTGYAHVGDVAGGTEVEIYEITGSGSHAWARIDKGWISMNYVELTPEDSEDSSTEKPDDSGTTETPDEKPIGTGVIIDCDTLRIRQGPGTKYAHVGNVAGGTKVEIYETTGRGSQTWARIAGGWINMTYVEMTPVGSEDSGSAEKPDDSGTTETPDGEPVATGVIVDCDTLRIRRGPGTKYTQVGNVAEGTKVAIYEITGRGSQTWARIAEGWINMTYVELTEENAPETEKPETETPETEKPETETPETEKPETETPETEKPETEQPESTNAAQSGTIVKTSELRIRAGAGTQYDAVGTLYKGDKVVIQETAKVGNATWGRTDKGWVHMYYVQLDGVEVPTGSVYKTVTVDGLKIRAGAGTSYDKVGTYDKGDVVLIYEQTTVEDRPWGRTDRGWICLEYVK